MQMENYVVSQHEEESLSVILMSTKNTSTYLSHSGDANPLGKTSLKTNAQYNSNLFHTYFEILQTF